MIKIDLDKQVEDRIKECHKKYAEEKIYKKCEDKLQLLENEKEDIYYNFVLELLGKKEIIEFCTSPELTELIKKFNEAFEKFFSGKKFEITEKTDKNEKTVSDKVKEILDYIFCYRDFYNGCDIVLTEQGREEKLSWNRHRFVNEIGVKVCPYCNRNYITSYIDDEDIPKTTADVDHYYRKETFPYLQMNIYNMIPSCAVCNSRMKLIRDVEHLNPYKDASKSICFRVPEEDVGELISGNVKKILLSYCESYDEATKERAENSNIVFKLDKVYQAHRVDAEKVMESMKRYCNFQEKYYQDVLGLEGIDVFELWFDFLETDPLDEPLVKMKQDIYDQFNT